MGISPETLKAWKAGYATTGTNRGRLAIALHDRDGNVLGFAGRSLGSEQPPLSIPNGINPHEIIFGSDRVEQGPLYLVRDVLKEAGDAVVLEPEDARAAVGEAAEVIRAAIAPVTAG